MSLPFDPLSPWLAPLAGWSDLPLRLLARRLGAAVCCTEMVSAKGLVYGGRNTEELLATCPEDSPLVVQIFGDEPEFLEKAIGLLKERGFVWFDLNMGCSVPKVTKTGSGAALLKDLNKALAAAEAVLRAAGPGQAGFKIRLGWEAPRDPAAAPATDPFWLLLARELEHMGAGWLTLHPRYAKQGFSGLADHQATLRLAQKVSIPVLASGDLFSAEDGARLLARGGLSGVMYARGALNDPAIFLKHKLLLSGEAEAEALLAPGTSHFFGPGVTEKENLVALIRCHAALMQQYSPQRAILKMRTIIPRYVRHLDGSKALRKSLITCNGWDELDRILEEEFG